MYLNEIYKESFYSTKESYSGEDLNLSSVIESDSLLKIEVFEINAFQPLTGTYILNDSTYVDESSLSGSYPDNALKIELKKGTYGILYEEGGLISKTTGKVNDCIRSSALSSIEKLDFGEFEIDSNELSSVTNENYNDVLISKNYKCLKPNIIKINSKTKLHIWINDQDVVGSFTFTLFKISSGKYTEKKIKSCIVGDNINDFIVDTEPNKVYRIVVSELKTDSSIDPHPKYPVGTYQITKYDIISKFSTIEEFNSIKERDEQRFIRENDKLTSLKNIDIPYNINPLNQYIMLGKVELLLYIDLTNDEYYIRPGTYAEVFMNLFVPQKEVTLVEETDSYIIYNIIDYIIVNYDFRNKSRIIESIKNWLDCTDDDIHSDEYDIYFYITNFGIYDWYTTRFIDLIKENFKFIEVNPSVTVFDNVDQSNADEVFDNVEISDCTWRINENPNVINYNVVKWNYDVDWEATNVQNQVTMTVNGVGYVRVTKKHFFNVTGIDLDVVTNGTLTDAQYKEFKLNYPVMNPYNRLQSWLGIKL